jgi:hypothetical protein
MFADQNQQAIVKAAGAATGAIPSGANRETGEGA